ncbi:MAG: hypothetical protein ACLPTZ_08525 [Beijerinckiaceae bacterium]
MPTFIYRCPNTGYLVQGITSDEVSDDDEYYVATFCDLCQRLHLVNPKTGEVLGAKNE